MNSVRLNHMTYLHRRQVVKIWGLEKMSDSYWYSFFWLSLNYISVSIIWKTNYFQLWFFPKSNMCIYTAEHIHNLSELNNFNSRKTTISSTLLIREMFIFYIYHFLIYQHFIVKRTHDSKFSLFIHWALY